MLFGLDKETQTTFLFYFILFFFFIVLYTYRGMGTERLKRIQKKSLLLDWRIWAVCLIYTIILGFRYDYLNDWEQYVKYYEYVQNGGFNDGWHEPGFYIFVKILTLLGFNYYAMFVIECFIWVYSICYLFKDNRQYLLFVLPLVYITSTDAALNICRQYFALSFLLIAFRKYWDGNNTKALVLALIAPILHYSAAIWLVFFFILKRIDYIKPIWMISAFVIVTITSSLLFNTLASSTEFISTFFSAYFDNKIYDTSIIEDLQSESTGANLRQIFTLGLTRFLYIILYYYYRKHKFLTDPILNNFALIGMIGIIVTLLLGYNLVFSRIASYIRVFYHIGWGIFIYIAFIRCRSYVNIALKLSVLLVVFYMFGSFFLNYGASRRAEIKDVNPYLIYEID